MKVVIAAGLVAALISAASATAAFVVTSANIKNGTIQMADISTKAKRALKGNRGPRGFAGQDGFDGAPGPLGPQGPQGPPGIQRWRIINTSVSVPPNTASGAVRATCGAGEVAISGGFIFAGFIIGSTPAGESWIASGFNDVDVPLTLNVYAVCAAVTGTVATGTTAAGALQSDSLRTAAATVSKTR